MGLVSPIVARPAQEDVADQRALGDAVVIGLAVVVHVGAVVDQVVDEHQLARARQRIALHDVRQQVAHHGHAAAAGARAEQHAEAMRFGAVAIVVGMERIVERLRKRCCWRT